VQIFLQLATGEESITLRRQTLPKNTTISVVKFNNVGIGMKGVVISYKLIEKELHKKNILIKNIRTYRLDNSIMAHWYWLEFEINSRSNTMRKIFHFRF